uniref:Conserved plasmodium protein n=1 Tax=Babesia bovis TaxID=5865 RepID=S6BLU4_BABBO|nr:conserved plasmodium protein [Babesia bovis]
MACNADDEGIPLQTMGATAHSGGAPTNLDVEIADIIPNLPNQNSRHLRMHVAAFYESYCNLKARLGKRIKERVMRFMRHEIDRNNAGAPSGGRDVKGGNARRASDVTYDSLILKITLFLGFLLQYPMMWFVGSVLFCAGNTTKSSVMKWGCANMFLSTLSIIYSVTQATHRFPGATILDTTIHYEYESSPTEEIWSSTILDSDLRVDFKRFVFQEDQLWEPSVDLKPRGDYEALSLGGNGNLIESRDFEGMGQIYIEKNQEVHLNGYVQVGAKMSCDKVNVSGDVPHRYSGSREFPVVYLPHHEPIFDVGFRCTDANYNVLWIGVNAHDVKDNYMQSTVFHISYMLTCTLAYVTNGSRPTVHEVFLKTLE